MEAFVSIGMLGAPIAHEPRWWCLSMHASKLTTRPDSCSHFLFSFYVTDHVRLITIVVAALQMSDVLSFCAGAHVAVEVRPMTPVHP